MIFWILIAVIAAMGAVMAIMFMYYIAPIKNSPARHFIKARKKRLPLIILDCGNYYKAILTKKHEDGYIRGPNNEIVFETPNALKSFEGIMLGIGEDYRKVIATAGAAQMCELVNKKKWDQKKMDSILQTINKAQNEGMTPEEFKEFIEKMGMEKKENIKKQEEPHENTTNTEEGQEEGQRA